MTQISAFNSAESSIQSPPSSTLLDTIKISLDDGKADNIVCIDLKGKSSIADYMVVTSGTSNRHIQGLADRLRRDLRDTYAIRCHIEGENNSDWVVCDAGDVIVHLFRPEARDLYNLERMWGGDF